MAHIRRPRQCEVCTTEYRPTYRDQRTCSRACGLQLKRTITLTQLAKAEPEPVQLLMLVAQCRQCALPFLATDPRASLCSADCRRRRANAAVLAGYHDGRYRDRMLKHAHLRRARLLNLQGSEHVRLRVVARRDHWICQLCGKPVPRKADPNNRATMASLDHITPLSRGGTHTYNNVQLAHYRCNLSKGAGGRISRFI